MKGLTGGLVPGRTRRKGDLESWKRESGKGFAVWDVLLGTEDGVPEAQKWVGKV